MNQSIGQKFNVISLLRFAAPSIIMMVFMSLYTIIDGFFIARYAGKRSSFGCEYCLPVVNVLYACGIMFATGGSAIVAKKLGQQKEKGSQKRFYFDRCSRFADQYFIFGVRNDLYRAIIKSIGIKCHAFAGL